MFGLGNLIAAPIRLLNVPMRAVEKLAAHASGEPDLPEDRELSAPLESVAQSIEEAIDGEDD